MRHCWAWHVQAFIMCSTLSRHQFITSAILSATTVSFVNDADAEDTPSTSPVVRRTLNKIYFSGDVNTASCQVLRQAIDDAALESKTLQVAYSLTDPPALELHIQSTGGGLMPTLAAIDTITGCSVPIHSYIAPGKFTVRFAMQEQFDIFQLQCIKQCVHCWCIHTIVELY